MTTDAPPPAATATSADDSRASLRWAVYALLMAIAVGQMAGRILAVHAIPSTAILTHRVEERLREFQQRQEATGADEEVVADRVRRKRAELAAQVGLDRPFLSANDRSRWLTVRALVEEGTYEVDDLHILPGWDSIDMVSHLGRDGERHFYSSKPPLLATLVAGKYWLLRQITGWSFETHTYEIVRTLLLLVNVPAMLILFLMVALLAEQLGSTDWGRVFVVSAVTLATPLTTFAITLNNHTIAAASAAVALYFYVQIARAANPRGWHFAACGLATAFTAANELPAAAFLALLGLLLLFHDWKKTLLLGVPAVLLVAAAFFGTNYLAHDSLRPPYMHRSDTDPADDWYTYSYEKNGRTIQSYWQDRRGIDVGEPLKSTYALHVLVGHHGVFSLTPIWLLALGGMAMWALGVGPSCRDGRPTTMELRSAVPPGRRDLHSGRLQRELALLALALTITCLVFFIALRPLGDRNYGGMTSGFRWMFWFAPLWLVTMLPMVDVMARSRVARGVALVLLAFSALSVAYPTWNPWVHPWIYNWMDHHGWL